MTDHIQPDYVTLREFTALVERVARIEIAAESSEKDTGARFDKIMDKIDSLKTDMYSYRNGVLLRVVGWGVSFILGGGGMIGILNAFHLLK